jgi:hypothetical protein
MGEDVMSPVPNATKGHSSDGRLADITEASLWQRVKWCPLLQPKPISTKGLVVYWVYNEMREPSEHLEEKHATNPPTWHVNGWYFLHSQEQGGQDCTLQFWGGLANYKAHGNLSWFRPLLRGNSPTSSGLILKMNWFYNGVSRELTKFAWWRVKWISFPLPEG